MTRFVELSAWYVAYDTYKCEGVSAEMLNMTWLQIRKLQNDQEVKLNNLKYQFGQKLNVI